MSSEKTPTATRLMPTAATSHSLKESQTSADLIEHQKSILKSILEQSRQPSAGAGLPASKPKFVFNESEHHFDEPPPLTHIYANPPPASANAANSNAPPSSGGSIKRNTNTSNTGGSSSANKAAAAAAGSQPHIDEYLDSVLEAKDRRQSWQNMHTQKSVRSYVPSLSVICKSLFLLHV